MAQAFQRPQDGFRFAFGGMKTNAPPDALSPGKYPIAVNIRGYDDRTTRTRPGQTLLYIAGATFPVTDIRALTALQTDNRPRFFSRNSSDQIWLDDGVQVGILAAGGPGAVMIPFRPNASPQPYLYIANGTDYQKFSAPDSLNTVVQSNVGIAEPQSPPSAAPLSQVFTELLAPGGLWTAGGTASASTPSNRSTDLIVNSLPDPGMPASSPTPSRWSLQVSPSTEYQIGEIVYLNSTPVARIAIIEDVIAPLAITMPIAGIYYFDTGANTGRCVIVPEGVSASPVNTQTAGSTQSGVATSQGQLIAQLRRGALIQVGTEVSYVWSVTRGPNNSICIETSTIGTHTAAESVTGLPTIVVNGIALLTQVAPTTPIVGDQSNVQTFPVTVGIGTLTMGASGGAGVVVARPTTLLNGWGPLAHVGAYEMGVDQGFGWGLDSSTTAAYANPQLAYDGNLATAATVAIAHSHQYAGCVWSFAPIAPQSTALTLNINSMVPPGQTLRSAGIWHTLNGGAASPSWTQIYNQASRAQQWDSIPLPANQDMSQVQVMAFTDSHDDMAHQVFEINVTAAPNNPVIGASTGAYNDDDYIHISVKVDDLANLAEIKLQFDVGDGSFTQNYFYYSIRPSDLVSATANSTTQLGSIQAIMQEGAVFQTAEEAGLAISSPTVAGDNQWTEVWFPISALTRVGGDMTKSMANIVGIQVLVNALATINVSFSSLAFVGGGQPDNANLPIAQAEYRYRVRPRDSRTGVVGNPSPSTRYGVTARRQPIQIIVPYSPADPQIDTWDIERFGGSVTSWRRVGSTTANALSSLFIDNYDDVAAQTGEPLDFDNYEPWPSIDYPLFPGFTAANITGTVAVLTINAVSATTILSPLRWLPGTQVQIGGLNAYTLRKRPTFVSTVPGSTTYLLEFEECADASTGSKVSIPEPVLARQPQPYMWGPDAAGRVFACGDPLRPGTLSYARSNNPDSAPDTHNREITAPTEPLLGGEVLDGLSFVGSSKRWWALYPNQNAEANPTQFYTPVELPVLRGLAAPYGHCNDGTQIFFWAKDGFYSTTKGSLTDGDLYNLFPHEGVAGQIVNYNGIIVQPPDYSRAGAFRAAFINGYVYAIYQDSGGVYRCLVLNVATGGWSVDEYAPRISAVYQPEQPSGTLSSLPNQLYKQLIMGTLDGRVAVQTDFANDLDAPIACALATMEFDGGDLRSGEQWGDIFLDVIAAAKGVALSLTPMFLGSPASAAQTPTVSPARQQVPVSIGGELTTNYLGALLQWTDDYTAQAVATTLFAWQPSFISRPEIIADRITDWDNAGSEGAKWWQGFILEADTLDVVKGLVVRDAEFLQPHPFTPQVQHNGQSEIAYSFDTPFIAHLARLEPQGAVPWRLFGVRWVTQPTPETARTWQTQASTHGMRGFMSLRQLSLTYASTQPVTFQATSFDGLSPAAVTLPATGGAVQKIVAPFSANKGQLFTYRATSPEIFQVYEDKSELLIGMWGRQDSLQNVPLVGGVGGDHAEV